MSTRLTLLSCCTRVISRYKMVEETSHCRVYWWTNLLNVNNFIPEDFHATCMSWTWYLANDIQFYIVALIIMFVYVEAQSLCCRRSDQDPLRHYTMCCMYPAFLLTPSACTLKSVLAAVSCQCQCLKQSILLTLVRPTHSVLTRHCRFPVYPLNDDRPKVHSHAHSWCCTCGCRYMRQSRHWIHHRF